MKWKVPQLLILVRGESAENVLHGCKYWAPSGSESSNYSCQIQDDGAEPEPLPCADSCHAQHPS